MGSSHVWPSGQPSPPAARTIAEDDSRMILHALPSTTHSRHHDAYLPDATLPSVRTTVTLDDDLAARLRERARERDLSFKAVLNEAIRSGLTDPRPPSDPYRMKVSPMRAKPEIDLTKALRLAGQLEDEEIVRKLEQGR